MTLTEMLHSRLCLSPLCA